MIRSRLTSLFVPFFAVFSVVVTTAQSALDPCVAALEAYWAAASDTCVAGPYGFFCNGGSAPSATPAGPVANTLAASGALVEVGVVESLQTPPLDPAANTAGIMWMRVDAPVSTMALKLGAVTARNVTPPGYPAWQSVVVETSPEPPACSAAPASSYIVQSVAGQTGRIVINGASLALDGTVMVRTVDTTTLFVGLSGQSSIIVFGQEQPLWTGQQVSVTYAPGDFSRPQGPASAPAPLDLSLLQNLPVALLDRPIILPQPGFVRTDGAVNLRSEPSIYAGIITEVPPGQVMSVLGRNTAGDWYHVRLRGGETGWMLAELLTQNVGAIQAVYDATPMPPQRYGELGTNGRIIAPAGVSLRTGPDATFPALGAVPNGTLVRLLERSPYSPWVKVDSSGAIGWVALISLETKAFIDALPVDYSVPPPPTPTLIPGSFGNAFPDPNS